jgi:hypothetical protein
MTHRITYVSRYSKPMDTHELEALGEAAAAKNRKLGITGFLMATGGMFYQVLEGPQDAVEDIYSAIVEDDRHTDLIQLRSEKNAPGLLYPDWSMKTINLDAASHVRLLPLKASSSLSTSRNGWSTICCGRSSARCSTRRATFKSPEVP